jgi:hypothetical protein
MRRDGGKNAKRRSILMQWLARGQRGLQNDPFVVTACGRDWGGCDGNLDALWRMEDEFWKGGAETYRRNLSDDSLMGAMTSASIFAHCLILAIAPVPST